MHALGFVPCNSSAVVIVHDHFEPPWRYRLLELFLGQSGINRIRCLISHAWEYVAVGVQGYGYGGVPQQLLDELRVDASR